MEDEYSHKGQGIIKDHVYRVVGDIKKLPNFGFKIHISATPTNAQDILNEVENFCLSKDITYKFIYTKTKYFNSLKKDFSRFSSAKFITVYPKNTNQFKNIIDSLYKKIGTKYSGPYVLSDLNYKDSTILYYRYGRLSKDAPMMISYDGASYTDDNKSIYSLPDWIEEPFKDTKNIPSSILLKKYKINKCIHISNTGGIYHATDKSDGKIVVIKEARPYVGYSKDSKLDSIDFRKNEVEMFKSVNNLINVPNFFEDFYDSSHYFEVVEFLDGQTLFDLFKTKIFVENVKNITDYPMPLLKKMLSDIKKLHKNYFYLGDLSSVNVMINSDNQIYYIDMEHAGKGIESTYSTHHAPGFKLNNYHFNVFEQDVQSLALIYLSAYSYKYKENSEEVYIQNLIKKLVEHEVISSQVVFKLKQMLFQPSEFIKNKYEF